LAVNAIKKLIPFLAVPVFLAYGHDGAVPDKIVEASLDDTRVTLGSTLACDVVVRGRRFLAEGLLIGKEPLTLIIGTDLGLLPLAVKDENALFCLASDARLR
jgi:hypothetical protein